MCSGGEAGTGIGYFVDALNENEKGIENQNRAATWKPPCKKGNGYCGTTFRERRCQNECGNLGESAYHNVYHCHFYHHLACFRPTFMVSA